MTAWAVGREPVMSSPGEFDTVWGWDIWTGHEPKLIASGEITGQIDEPPNLSAILLDWQSQVAGAVMTAMETAKPGNMAQASHRRLTATAILLASTKWF